MSSPSPDGSDRRDPGVRVDQDDSHDGWKYEDRGLSTAGLLADARRRLRENLPALFALLAAGVIVAGTDWLLRRDPVPTVGYTSVLDGRFSVTIGVVVRVISDASTPLSALIGLRPRWLAWTIGLELPAFLVVSGAGAYPLARLLGVGLTRAAVLRYVAVAAVLRLASVNFDLAGGAVVLAIVLIPLAFVLLVRLFAVPGFLIVGRSIPDAFRDSWHRTRGHGRALFGVVFFIGLLNHLLASVSAIGPIGSALAGALHAGGVAAFLRQSEGVKSSLSRNESFSDRDSRSTSGPATSTDQL